MPELDKRLDDIELKIESMARPLSSMLLYRPPMQADELDLREIWAIVWARRWKITACVFISAILGAFFLIRLPNIYTSEGVFAPAQKQSQAGSLAAQYGGLAAIAGIDLLGGETAEIDQALVLINSWPFIKSLIQKYDLKSHVMAVERWDKESMELVWDRSIYNPEKKTWERDSDGNSLEPTDYDCFKAIVKNLSVSKDTKTGLVYISFEHYSPVFASNMVDLLLKNINLYFQEKAVREARKNIEYLEKKALQTSVVQMQSVFYGLVETQIKTLMLAEVGDEYVLKTVVPHLAPEEKSKPKRVLMLLAFVFFVSVIASFVALILGLRRGESHDV
jgi:uncharacterized protein involved in exopolysaccharide biosynthesis